MFSQQQLKYWGYLNPVVRDRLINYYASDTVFSDIKDTVAIATALPDFAKRIEDFEALLAYKPNIEWYSQITDEVYSLVQRESTIIETADAIAGQIISDYFKKVTDLVAGHSNLIWYANPNVVSAINPLITRSDIIQEITDSISKGILPTIRERAMFEKGADFLGRVNQLGPIGDLAEDFRNNMDYSHGGYDFRWPPYIGGRFYSPAEIKTGIEGFRDWLSDMSFHIDLIMQDLNEPWTKVRIWEFLFHFRRGFDFLERIVNFIDRLSKRIPDGGWR